MKQLDSMEEIKIHFSNLLNSEEPGGLFQLSRIYGMAQRHEEDNNRTSFIDDAYKDNRSTYVSDKHYIFDRLSIAELTVRHGGNQEKQYAPFVDGKDKHYRYFAFIDALIAGICMVYNSGDCASYMLRMLGIEMLDRAEDNRNV